MMDAQFWHDRWANNEIGFHKSEANPLLVKYFTDLALAKGSRVFVPLCGKTLDIPWLLSNDYRVAGAELSPIAIEELFAQLGVNQRSRGTVEQIITARTISTFLSAIFSM